MHELKVVTDRTLISRRQITVDNCELGYLFVSGYTNERILKKKKNKRTNERTNEGRREKRIKVTT